MKYLYALGLFVFGIVVIVYTVPFVKFFGRLDWAEQWLGATGTYSAWKIIGVACIIGAVVVLQNL